MRKSKASAFILLLTEKANIYAKILYAKNLPSTFSKCASTSFKQISEMNI